MLRKKVQDVEPSLPPGAGKPKVGDDFGYVYGFLLSVSSDGYSYAELEHVIRTGETGVSKPARAALKRK